MWKRTASAACWSPDIDFEESVPNVKYGKKSGDDKEELRCKLDKILVEVTNANGNGNGNGNGKETDGSVTVSSHGSREKCGMM